uniref:NDUFA4 mitochondrial complex associated like 2 n=1 Tax=Amphiprion ocellaris TaxID=80972 RepID=A0AAQ5XBT3_AMPOC
RKHCIDPSVICDAIQNLYDNNTALHLLSCQTPSVLFTYKSKACPYPEVLRSYVVLSGFECFSSVYCSFKVADIKVLSADTLLINNKLIPQFFFTTLGVTGATIYLIRLAKGPHVTLWDKKNNPEPWNKLDPTYQYKFVAVNTDYKSLKKEGPDF